MRREEMGNVIGGWAFLAGVVLAIILTFLGSLNATLMIILVVIGLIIGLLNVADEEVEPFLMSGAVLIIASAFGQGVVSQVPLLERMLQALLVLFVPATIVVAIKNVFGMARH